MNALVSPGFSLTTGWAQLSLDPLFYGVPLTVAPEGPTISCGPDDVLYLGTFNLGLWSYNMTQGQWASVNALALVPATSIAALNANSAYAGIGDQWVGSQTPLTITRFDNGQPTNLPVLPDQDQPMETAAAQDGTLWVLGRSGAVYRWSENTWAHLDNVGFAIEHLSIGGANNIWAIAVSGAERKVVQYVAGTGWQVDTFFAGKTPDWISACEDGSVWVAVAATFYLRVAGQPWQLQVPTLPSSTSVSGFTASSQYRCYALVTDAGGKVSVQCLSLGVVDRQPVPWPSMTAGQQDVYNAISWYVGGTEGGSIRSLYTDQLADFDILFATLEGWTRPAFESWYTDNVGKPVPSPEDWQKIKVQIEAELSYAQAVRKLQAQIKDLTNQIAIVNDAVMPAVWAMVGLTAPQGSDGESSIDLWLGGLVEAIAWGIATVFSDGLAAFAAAAVASLIGTSVSALQGAGQQPNQSNALTIKYAQLTDTISKLYLASNLLTDTTSETIVQDWGMLSAVGSAIKSGKWFWTETASDQLAAATKVAFEISFYQSLVPAKWQILYTLWGNYVQYGWVYTPAYATHTTQIPPVPGSFPVENVWFCNLLGNPSHVSRGLDGDNFAPYPDPALFDTLTSLGVDRGDFFQGRNGWALQTQTLVFE